MNVDDIVSEIETLGFSEDHARLYIRMLRTGPAKASTLTETSEFSRSKVYRTLDKMVEQGIAQASIDQPTIYTPTPPEDVFDLLARRWRRGAERTEKARHRIQQRLQKLYRAEAEPRAEASWRIVQGREDIADTLEEVLRSAQELIDVFSTLPLDEVPDLRILSVVDAIEDRADAGVEARLALPFDERLPDRFEPLVEHPDVKVRRLPGDAEGHSVVIDGRICLSWLTLAKNGDRDDDTILQTDAGTFVDTAAWLFRCMWTQAEPVEPEGSGPRAKAAGDGSAELRM